MAEPIQATNDDEPKYLEDRLAKLLGAFQLSPRNRRRRSTMARNRNDWFVAIIWAAAAVYIATDYISRHLP